MPRTSLMILTPNEVAALAELPVKRVHKELEHHVIETTSPPRLRFSALIYLRSLKLMDIKFSVDVRARLYQRIAEALAHRPIAESIPVAELLTLHLTSVVQDMEERLERFVRWRDRLVTDVEIMGGETVFPASRLTVRHVGEMLERGAAPEVILEDYPYLTVEDLEFAPMYVRAYPRVGRPREQPARAR